MFRLISFILLLLFSSISQAQRDDFDTQLCSEYENDLQTLINRIHSSAYIRYILSDKNYHEPAETLDISILDQLEHDYKTSYLILIKEGDKPENKHNRSDVAILSVFTFKPFLGLANYSCLERRYIERHYLPYQKRLDALWGARISMLEINDEPFIKIDTNTINRDTYTNYLPIWILRADENKWTSVFEQSLYTYPDSKEAKLQFSRSQLLNKTYPSIKAIEHKTEEVIATYLYDGDQFISQRDLFLRLTSEKPFYRLLNKRIRMTNQSFDNSCLSSETRKNGIVLNSEISFPYYWEDDRSGRRIERINSTIASAIPEDLNKIKAEGFIKSQEIDYKILLQTSKVFSIEFKYQYGYCMESYQDSGYSAVNINPLTGESISILQAYQSVNEDKSVQQEKLKSIIYASITKFLKANFKHLKNDNSVFRKSYWGDKKLSRYTFGLDKERLYIYFNSCNLIGCAFGSMKIPVQDK